MEANSDYRELIENYSRYAILKDGFVEEIIFADSAESFRVFYGNNDYVELASNDYQTMPGSYYFKHLEKFKHPAPFASWSFDPQKFLWRPPVSPPQTDIPHVWDEENQRWAKV